MGVLVRWLWEGVLKEPRGWQRGSFSMTFVIVHKAPRKLLNVWIFGKIVLDFLEMAHTN
jgi:hypothetical protein